MPCSKNNYSFSPSVNLPYKRCFAPLFLKVDLKAHRWFGCCYLL